MHTICTHTQHRIQNTDIQIQQYKIQQHAAHTPQHRTPAYDLYTYSFDFYHLQQYIKKLYNTAIYKLYTNYIHFARLIDEVSKITNRIQTYKKLLYHDIDKPYILLFN